MGNQGTNGGILRHKEVTNMHDAGRMLSFHLQVLKWRAPRPLRRISLLVMERRKCETSEDPSKNAVDRVCGEFHVPRDTHLQDRHVGHPPLWL